MVKIVKLWFSTQKMTIKQENRYFAFVKQAKIIR